MTKARPLLRYLGGVVLFFPLLLSVPAHAAALGGHIKYQFSQTYYAGDDLLAQFGDRRPSDHDLDLRLTAEQRTGPWEFIGHYEILGISGDSPATRRRAQVFYPSLFPARTLSGLPQDDRRLFDLTDEISDSTQRSGVQRFDRLSFAYLQGNTVIRLGRQAITWGNGLVFQALDIFNPFPPLSVDKEYKTGDDLLYSQWTSAQGDDVQTILLPRRDPVDGRVRGAQGSYAVKWHGRPLGMDVDILAGEHYDEPLLGLGLTASVGGAIVRADILFTDLQGGGHSTVLATNLDYSWRAWDKNIYGYLEYFHNSLGETAVQNYLVPNAPLATRLARAQLFTLGKDYLATGLRVELNPLFNLLPGVIVNLHDASGVLQTHGIYDWTQNWQWSGGVYWPFGARASEYGGIPLSVAGPYLGRGKSLYIKAAYFF